MLGSAIRILMFPGKGNVSENRYIDILVEALLRGGAKVTSWNHHFSIQTGDVFHVHWPDVISDIYLRPYQSLRAYYIYWLFFSTIRRVKRTGGKVVWTVHDIQPHKSALRGLRFHTRLIDKFIGTVDACIVLVPSAIDRTRAAFPVLSDKPFFVCHHPHYRSVFGVGSYNRELRASFGVQPTQKIVGFLGTMRPNKNVERLVRVFVTLDPSRYYLVLAGKAEEEMRTTLNDILFDVTNYFSRFDRLTDIEMISLHSVLDYLAFPASDDFTSATIYTALTLGVPVIACSTKSNLDLQRIVGSEWLYLYDGELDADTILRATAVLASRSEGHFLDLASLDPAICAQAHLKAFSALIP